MYISRYLVISSRGRCRITKHRPSLASDEIVCNLEMTLPDSLFKKPIIQAKVVIPNNAVTPEALNAEVLLNTKDLLEKGTGLRVELVSVVEKEVPP